MHKVNKKALLSLIFVAIVCFAFFILLNSREDTVGPKTITGTVTSKFTDCAGGEEMDKNGVVTPIKNVSCDGGSSITIDYKDSFTTETGLVASGNYSVDVSSINVGDRVKVQYVNDSDGYKSLHCESCGVQRIK